MEENSCVKGYASRKSCALSLIGPKVAANACKNLELEGKKHKIKDETNLWRGLVFRERIERGRFLRRGHVAAGTVAGPAGENSFGFTTQEQKT